MGKYEDIKSILQVYLKNISCDSNVSIDKIVDLLVGLPGNITGAHIKNLCHKALMARIRKAILEDEGMSLSMTDVINKGNEFNNDIDNLNQTQPTVGMDCFYLAFEEAFPGLLQQYNNSNHVVSAAVLSTGKHDGGYSVNDDSSPQLAFEWKGGFDHGARF